MSDIRRELNTPYTLKDMMKRTVSMHGFCREKMIKKFLQRDTKPKLHTTVPEKKKLGEEQRNDAVSRNNNNTINYQHIINTYILHNVVHII